jgi:hypothetical protein
LYGNREISLLWLRDCMKIARLKMQACSHAREAYGLSLRSELFSPAEPEDG